MSPLLSGAIRIRLNKFPARVSNSNSDPFPASGPSGGYQVESRWSERPCEQKKPSPNTLAIMNAGRGVKRKRGPVKPHHSTQTKASISLEPPSRQLLSKIIFNYQAHLTPEQILPGKLVRRLSSSSGV